MLVNSSHLTVSPFNTFAYPALGRAVTGFFRLTHLNGLGGGAWGSDCDGECGPLFELHPVFPKKIGAGDLTLETGDIPDKPSPGKRPKPLPAPEEDKDCPYGRQKIDLGVWGDCSCSVNCCWGESSGGLLGWLLGHKKEKVLRPEKSFVWCQKASKVPGGTLIEAAGEPLTASSGGGFKKVCGPGADDQAVLAAGRSGCGMPSSEGARLNILDCMKKCLKGKVEEELKKDPAEMFGDPERLVEDCLSDCLKKMGCEAAMSWILNDIKAKAFENCYEAMLKPQEDPLAKCCWDYISCVADKCCPKVKLSCSLACHNDLVDCMREHPLGE
jgi:hypothetical protein